jgi:hypothetical protein
MNLSAKKLFFSPLVSLRIPVTHLFLILELSLLRPRDLESNFLEMA